MNFRMLLVVVLMLTTSVLTACSEPSSGSGTTPPNGPPGSQEGGQLGTNSSPISSLRKIVPFSITNPNTDYSIGTTYVARSSTASSAIYWVTDVTNIGTATSCFVKLNTGEYRSSNGAVLDTEIAAYVHGTMRDLGSNIYTNTCLAPGQIGHFIGITLNVSFDQIDSIVFDNLSVSSSASSAPALTMSPVGYTVANTTPPLQWIDLTVHNNGPANGVVGILSLSLLLDSADNPLIWTFFSPPTTWDGSLSAGANGVLESSLLYEGASTNLLVYLDYDAALTAQSLSLATPKPLLKNTDFASVEEFQKYILTLRADQENLKQLSQ